LLQVGIKGDGLILAFEPEVASIYCKEVSAQEKHADYDIHDFPLAAYDVGTKFIVVDLGGMNNYHKENEIKLKL